jgi:hypothetical protein
MPVCCSQCSMPASILYIIPHACQYILISLCTGKDLLWWAYCFEDHVSTTFRFCTDSLFKERVCGNETSKATCGTDFLRKLNNSIAPVSTATNTKAKRTYKMRKEWASSWSAWTSPCLVLFCGFAFFCHVFQNNKNLSSPIGSVEVQLLQLDNNWTHPTLNYHFSFRSHPGP